MTSNTSHTRERLGELLIRRRLDLDPRYRNRQVFADERGVEYRIVSDIERGRRSNFQAVTIAALEHAYALDAGAIERYLDGGELAEAPPETDAKVIHLPVSDDPIRRTLDVQRILGVTIDPGDMAVRELLELPLSPEQAAEEIRKLLKFRAEYSAGGLGTQRRERR